MRQAIIEQQVQNNLRWNFSVNLWDIMFITLGLSLISRDTVMPVMVSKVTDSKLIIGLIPALFTLGFYLPQLFSANLSERLAYKKPFVVLLGTGERLPYLIIAFVIWRWAIPNPTLALVLFFFLLGMAAFSGGYANPAWYDMIAKVIPVDRRGIWSGVGHGLGALMGIIGAYFVGYILQTFPYPDNFALLFVLGFVATAISWCGLILNREPPSSVVKEYIPLTHYLYRLPQIFHRDANYLRFILSRSLIQLGTMASGFYMVYGVQRFAIDGAGVGRLTALLIGSQAVMNLILGAVGDRHGHKLVLVLAAFAVGCAALLAVVGRSQLWLAFTFILLGVYLAADSVSGLNIVLEFCAPRTGLPILGSPIRCLPRSLHWPR